MNKDFTYGIKIGDLIIAYHAGYHIVSEITRRFYTEEDSKRNPERYPLGQEYNALIKYKIFADSNGKSKKSSRWNHCDAGFCSIVTDTSIAKTVKELEEKIESIKSMFKTYKSK